MAVILHGLSRSTKDYDIWLDPLPDVQSWAAPIQQLLTRETSVQARRISVVGRSRPISVDDIPLVGTEDSVIRIVGMERPIDMAFVPLEFETAEFAAVWERGTSIEQGLKLTEAIDLTVGKRTDRPIDE
jgi:hypothetical protein